MRLSIAQGIAGPLLYASAAVVGGLADPGYSHVSNAVSELTASGAPNQSALIPVFALTELQKIAFGVGVLLVVRDMSRTLMASAILIAVIGVLGLGFARFPMDQIGAPTSFDGQMHIAIVSISAVLAIAAITLAGIGWRSVHNGEHLSKWSFITLTIMLGSGLASALVVANGWPGLGGWQRINIGAFSAWQIATAVHLLRRIEADDWNEPRASVVLFNCRRLQSDAAGEPPWRSAMR